MLKWIGDDVIASPPNMWPMSGGNSRKKKNNYSRNGNAGKVRRLRYTRTEKTTSKREPLFQQQNKLFCQTTENITEIFVARTEQHRIVFLLIAGWRKVKKLIPIPQRDINLLYRFKVLTRSTDRPDILASHINARVPSYVLTSSPGFGTSIIFHWFTFFSPHKIE